MEDFLIISAGWSGEFFLWKYERKYPITLYWRADGSDKTNLIEFKRYEDFEQYMDELDNQYPDNWGGVPFRQTQDITPLTGKGGWVQDGE
jgi:hypothetical protein